MPHAYIVQFSFTFTILDQFETLFQTFLFRGDEYNHRGLDICPCTSARHRFVVAHFWITHPTR